LHELLDRFLLRRLHRCAPADLGVYAAPGLNLDIQAFAGAAEAVTLLVSG